jgi:hypothetical protein
VRADRSTRNGVQITLEDPEEGVYELRGRERCQKQRIPSIPSAVAPPAQVVRHTIPVHGRNGAALHTPAHWIFVRQVLGAALEVSSNKNLSRGEWPSYKRKTETRRIPTPAPTKLGGVGFARKLSSFALGKLRIFFGCEAAHYRRREHTLTIIKRDDVSRERVHPP